MEDNDDIIDFVSLNYWDTENNILSKIIYIYRLRTHYMKNIWSFNRYLNKKKKLQIAKDIIHTDDAIITLINAKLKSYLYNSKKEV